MREDTLERIRRFHSKDPRCPILASIEAPLPAETQERINQMASKLSKNEFPAAEQLFPIWEEYLSFYQRFEDDHVRFIYPRQYDQGIYGAMFGAEMEFLLESGWGWCSSNSTPFENRTYDELLSLGFNPENKWLHRMRKDLRCFSEKSCGRFRLSTIITIDGFNFAHQIRGSKFFEDIYDCPGRLKELLQHAVDINIKFVEFQRAATGETCEKDAISLGGLFPDRKTVAMSVDTYNMCSPATYEEFGRPYHQQLIDYFDGGDFHLHGNGRHLLPELAKLSGFVHIGIGDDGAGVRAFDDRENIRKKAGDALIAMSCGKDEFVKAMRERSLVPAKYVTGCESVEEANRLMEQVRNYTM